MHSSYCVLGVHHTFSYLQVFPILSLCNKDVEAHSFIRGSCSRRRRWVGALSATFKSGYRRYMRWTPNSASQSSSPSTPAPNSSLLHTLWPRWEKWSSWYRDKREFLKTKSYSNECNRLANKATQFCILRTYVTVRFQIFLRLNRRS
jgi:hypothetical protein